MPVLTRPERSLPRIVLSLESAHLGNFSQRSESLVFVAYSTTFPPTQCAPRCTCTQPVRQSISDQSSPHASQRLRPSDASRSTTASHACPDDAPERSPLFSGRQRDLSDHWLRRKLHSLCDVPDLELPLSNAPPVNLTERLVGLLCRPVARNSVHPCLDLVVGYLLDLPPGPNRRQVLPNRTRVPLEGVPAQTPRLVLPVLLDGRFKQHCKAPSSQNPMRPLRMDVVPISGIFAVTTCRLWQQGAGSGTAPPQRNTRRRREGRWSRFTS